MSHFYATAQGNRSERTCCGSKASGLTTRAASWKGAIQVTLSVDADGNDMFVISQIPWQGAGEYKHIASGSF